MMERFCFLNSEDISKINFGNINEINEEILLCSPDNNTVLITWEGDTPSFVSNFEYEYTILDHEQSTEYISNNNWDVFN